MAVIVAAKFDVRTATIINSSTLMLIVNERGVELRAKASEDQERQTTEYMAPALCGQRSDLKNDLSSV